MFASYSQVFLTFILGSSIRHSLGKPPYFSLYGLSPCCRQHYLNVEVLSVLNGGDIGHGKLEIGNMEFSNLLQSHTSMVNLD